MHWFSLRVPTFHFKSKQQDFNMYEKIQIKHYLNIFTNLEKYIIRSPSNISFYPSFSSTCSDDMGNGNDVKIHRKEVSSQKPKPLENYILF